MKCITGTKGESMVSEKRREKREKKKCGVTVWTDRHVYLTEQYLADPGSGIKQTTSCKIWGRTWSDERDEVWNIRKRDRPENRTEGSAGGRTKFRHAKLKRSDEQYSYKRRIMRIRWVSHEGAGAPKICLKKFRRRRELQRTEKPTGNGLKNEEMTDGMFRCRMRSKGQLQKCEKIQTGWPSETGPKKGPKRNSVRWGRE